MAWLYSFVALVAAFFTPRSDPNEPLHEGAFFFETSSTVITIILLGKWLQAKAKYYTSDSIGMLMDIQSSYCNLVEINQYGEIIGSARAVHKGPGPAPAQARRNSVDNDGISTELIVVGDIVRVYPGGRIPLDGTVIYGLSSIDESMITGESLARNVTVGDTVISSSINCGDNMILLRVDKNKNNSVISKVIELMKNSQMNKPKQQEFADTVSSYFVPVVILILLLRSL